MGDNFFKNPWEEDNEDNKNNNKNTEHVFFKKFVNINQTTDQKTKIKVVNVKINIINILLLLFGLWLLTGIYKIDTNQQGVVLYFGKFNKITTPGLNYMIPYPVGKLIKVPVTNINKEEFGFRSNGKDSRINVDTESLMLTGDENIIDIDFEVQWRIKDAKDYLFNLQNPSLTIKMATESAMREIIAKRKIDDALANKKSIIEEEVLSLLQQILNDYKSGIEIVLVQLLRVDPPEEVISAFRDVQTAKADKERKINEAETYKNDIIPKTRGEVESIIKNAEGYKESIISNAEGEVAYFLKIYKEYTKNPTLTKKRIYLETMKDVTKNVNKTIVSEKIGNNLLQHLQLNK